MIEVVYYILRIATANLNLKTLTRPNFVSLRVFRAQRAKLPAVVTAPVPQLKSGDAQNIADLFRVSCDTNC